MKKTIFAVLFLLTLIVGFGQARIGYPQWELANLAFGAFTNTTTKVVAAEGGDYTTLTAALASIADASATKPYTIEVYGNIAETTMIEPKSYVNVQGHGGAKVTVTSDTAVGAFGLGTISNATWSDLTIVREGTVGRAFAFEVTGISGSDVVFNRMNFISNGIGVEGTGGHFGAFGTTATTKAVFNNVTFKGSDDPTHPDQNGVRLGGGAGTSAPTFNSCSFIAGNGGTGSHGVSIRRAGAAVLNNSYFKGGDGNTTSVGLETESASSVTINGGYAQGGNGGFDGDGVYIRQGSPVISNLTVSPGDAGRSAGVLVEDIASPIISNLTVLPQRHSGTWNYDPANGGRWRPWESPAWTLYALHVRSLANIAPGTTLNIGTSVGVAAR